MAWEELTAWKRWWTLEGCCAYRCFGAAAKTEPVPGWQEAERGNNADEQNKWKNRKPASGCSRVHLRRKC